MKLSAVNDYTLNVLICPHNHSVNEMMKYTLYNNTALYQTHGMESYFIWAKSILRRIILIWHYNLFYEFLFHFWSRIRWLGESMCCVQLELEFMDGCWEDALLSTRMRPLGLTTELWQRWADYLLFGRGLHTSGMLGYGYRCESRFSGTSTGSPQRAAGYTRVLLLDIFDNFNHYIACALRCTTRGQNCNQTSFFESYNS